MRTIQVPDEIASALEDRARRAGLSLAEILRLLATDGHEDAPIRSHPDVMGGDDCVRGTRIPVWLLVSARQQGQSDVEILESYPALSALDLSAAWSHFARHPDRINAQRTQHEEA